MRQIIAERLTDLRRRIADAAHAAHRDPASVRVIAVSKTQPAEFIAEALAAGQVDFGENYVQELVSKAQQLGTHVVGGGSGGGPPHTCQQHAHPSLTNSKADSRAMPCMGGAGDRTRDTLEPTSLCWHFIGRLQRNKLNAVLPHVQWIHGVDSLALAQAIDARAGRPIDVLIQVNIGDEATKSGVAPDAVIPLLAACATLQHVHIRGMMCIPPPVDSADAARPYFARLRDVCDAANQAACYPSALTELSMGMSANFAAAIVEGSTMVRIGTAIFGERPAADCAPA